MNRRVVASGVVPGRGGRQWKARENEMTKTPTWQRLALAGALLLSVAGMAAASTITVPNGIAGGTCGAGNVNERQFGGNCGSLVTVTADQAPAYVQDNSPAAEATYRVRFYVNLAGKASTAPGTTGATYPSNALTMSSGNAFDLFAAYDGADPVPPATAGNKAFRIEAGYNGTDYTITGYIRNDAGSETATSTVVIKRGFRSIEAEWAKSTASGNNTGKLNLWIDGTAATGVSAVDVDTSSVNYVRWGAVDGLEAATSGTFKIDDFVSQRENYIGPSLPFSDVPTSNIFYRRIQSIYQAEVMPASGAGTFSPAGVVTRKEMAKFLLTSKFGTNYTPPACVTATFGDVPCSHPYAAWIYDLVAKSVTVGCGGGNYCPESSVNRNEMVVFIQKMFMVPTIVVPPACTTPPFTDVAIEPANPFCKWVLLATTGGTPLTAGCGGGNFCPADIVDRGQMSVFLGKQYSLPFIAVGP